MMYQMVCALDHCHRNSVAHCDLKLDNFLSTSRVEVATLKVYIESGLRVDR